MLHNLETFILVEYLVLKIHGIIYRNKFIRVLLEVFKSQHLSLSIFLRSKKIFEREKKRKIKGTKSNDNLTRRNEQRLTGDNEPDEIKTIRTRLLKVANCILVQIRFSKPTLVALTNDTFTLLL